MREVSPSYNNGEYSFSIHCDNLADSPDLRPEYPIRGNREQNIYTGYSGHHMQTNFQLSSDGTLSGTTRTWSNNELTGFHGAVAVTFLDANGQALYVAHKEYGVDCAGFWCGADDRTEAWVEQVPAAVLPKIRGYLIEHRHNPSWGGILSQFQAWLDSPEGKQAVEAGKVIVAIVSWL
jgi:hypothetical protein